MFFDLKKKISYKEWNVGFFNAIPEDLVSDNIDLSNITWLRRDSKFHCYADPFILNVSDCTIDLLVEDILLGSKNVATICHLSVDKCTGEIIEKYTLIDDNIHNSYPLIIRGDTLDEVYIVPENSYSTELNVYKYNTLLHSCEHFSTMLPVAVADATILPYNGAFYLFATSRNAYNKDLYMWTSNNRLYGYDLSPILIKSNLFGSRMAGDFMYVNNTVYRPAQDCLQGYGKGCLLYTSDAADE